MAARPRKQVDTSTYEGRFAARLKELREKAKLTAEQAAERMGIVPSAIYGWESGRNRPTIADLPKIAEALKLKKIKDILPNE
jgi:transcriptional regulator with XRE-family HTH domain